MDVMRSGAFTQHLHIRLKWDSSQFFAILSNEKISPLNSDWGATSDLQTPWNDFVFSLRRKCTDMYPLLPAGFHSLHLISGQQRVEWGHFWPHILLTHLQMFLLPVNWVFCNSFASLNHPALKWSSALKGGFQALTRTSHYDPPLMH